jgi:UDP-N-acetylmuramoylalanine--D-glutamate ligase
VDPGIINEVVPGGVDVPVIGELELGSMFCRAPIVAVTGTNGKTTTSSMIYSLITGAGRPAVLCGNIGNPLCGELEGVTDRHIVVLEVSSFQLQTIKHFKPYISVLLNIGQDHYDRHGSFEYYKASKLRIFENQKKGDWAVVHSSLRKDAVRAGAGFGKIFFGGADSDFQVTSDGLYSKGKDSPGLLLPAAEMGLKGRHNLINAAASAATGRILGIPDDVVKRTLAEFKGLPHRFQTVEEKNGVRYIDDSKATNIDSTIAALESCERTTVLIAGGRDKGGDYSSIAELVRRKVRAIVLIGEASSGIEEALEGCTAIRRARGMGEAVNEAAAMARRGDIVLLSPMCSSFDMFKDYAHRGEVFRESVLSLASEDTV